MGCRCGFAQSQEAYDSASNELFRTLDKVEEHLGGNRYLCGDTLTLADVCLFTTLIRFDLVYNALFKCTEKKLIEYRNLHGYTRDIYQVHHSFCIKPNLDFHRNKTKCFGTDPRSCRNLQFRSHHGWLLQNPFPAQSGWHSPRHPFRQSTRGASKAPRQRVIVIRRDRCERARFVEAAASARTWDFILNFCICRARSKGIVGLQNNVKQKHSFFINP